MPVFPIERSISLKGFSVRRNQVLICPAFCLMDYKVQGTTLIAAISISRMILPNKAKILTGNIAPHMSSYPGFDHPKDSISYRRLTLKTSNSDLILDC
jgi:hypothetical protein